MSFLSGFVKGLAIGVGAIIPGVSGGALAVIFGIYEKLADLTDSFFKNAKKNFHFFLPVGLGGIVGVLALSRIIKYLLENYGVELKYLFLGLIIGTLPSVFKQANKQGYKLIYFVPFITTFLATILFTVLENQAAHSIQIEEPGMIQLIVHGAIIGFGTIAPGVSASFILMYIGAYEGLMEAISNVDLAVLIPVAMGFMLGFYWFAKLINFLFKNVYGYTYYAILGFVVGSVIPIFPGIGISLQYFIGLLCAVIGFYVSFSLSKHNQKCDNC